MTIKGFFKPINCFLNFIGINETLIHIDLFSTHQWRYSIPNLCGLEKKGIVSG